MAEENSQMDCHTSSHLEVKALNGTIALVGQPNVGKSVLFQHLTGLHALVANYPGTTVEVSRGMARALPGIEVIDTPGLLTFPPHTEDERVTERVLLHEPLKAILQVGDAKNLRRTLLLTAQLAEMGCPLVLSLNMMDEATARGVVFDPQAISNALTVPVIPITAIQGKGVDNLTKALLEAIPSELEISYPAEIEVAINELSEQILNAPIASRSMILLWLGRDEIVEDWLRSHLDAQILQRFESLRTELEQTLSLSLNDVIQQTRLEYVQQIIQSAQIEIGSAIQGFSTKLERWMVHPVWGLPILAIILYALYWFVGVLGAGTLVNLLEGKLFGELINPWVINWVNRLVPFPFVEEFLVGEYGLWTMGMTYALALILPIVSTFFLAFAMMEDSGYLPRLAVLTNRMFRLLGLNGKAVLPIILGLGCVTMATLTTRVLENKRERILVTLLLALAIPCSAQLGVVMGMLAGISFTATMIWSGVVFGVLLVVGWLAAKLLPGERTTLLTELPPLRWPRLSNLFLKTIARLEWYLREVIPLFLVGTAMLFFFDKIGLLASLVNAFEPLVSGWLGLPPEASGAFLMGFLRRDFGATGLFVMEAQGMLNPLQVVVAMVTVTLFIPCIASVMVIYKERGWRTAVTILMIVFPLAFFVGGLLNRILTTLRWGL